MFHTRWVNGAQLIPSMLPPAIQVQGVILGSQQLHGLYEYKKCSCRVPGDLLGDQKSIPCPVPNDVVHSADRVKVRGFFNV